MKQKNRRDSSYWFLIFEMKFWEMIIIYILYAQVQILCTFPKMNATIQRMCIVYVVRMHRQVIDRLLTDFSHASSYRKILRAMRILCGNQNAMVIAFCRFCNIIKLQFFYYFKNNVSRAKKL